MVSAGLRMVSWLLMVVIMVSVARASDTSKDDSVEIIAKIDNFVERVMECEGIPGLSLAVVRNGQPFLARGYGVKDVDSLEPVNNDTVFLLASVTKAFSATVTGMVLEEHEGVDWDTPINDILGDAFILSDPIRTASINFKDCFSHRTGIARNDPMRIYGDSQQELLSRMQYLPFPLQYRDKYLYNNLMYGVATMALEKLEGGTPWEDLLNARVFVPLGMEDSTFIQRTTPEQWGEFAKGHYEEDDGSRRQVSLEVAKAYYGAFSSPGGICSTAEDMTLWLAAQVSWGRALDGSQVISPAVMQATHEPSNVNPSSERYRSPRFPVAWTQTDIAKGWREGVYRGYNISGHTGNQAGFMSQLSVLPGERLGVYVGINTNPGYYSRERITMFIYDLLLGIEPWLSEEDLCDVTKEEVKEAGDNMKGTEKIRKGGISGTDRENVINRKNRADKRNSKTLCTKAMETGEQCNDENNNNRNVNTNQRKNDDYVGVYGDYAYGNVTVSIPDPGDSLYLSYGDDKVVFLLSPSSEGVDDAFEGLGQVIYWYWDLDVQFHRDGEERNVESVTIGFDDLAPPTFQRDIDWNSPPPPPVLCP